MASVALITGAASGIGAATARRFIDGGWHVVGVDINPMDDLRHAVIADLRDVGQCRRAVSDATHSFGHLDAVVNAAGVWTEGPSRDTTETEWDRVVDLNLKGLYFVCSAAIPHLAATHGAIVNLSSDAGLQGNAGAAVYCASKGGVSMLTKALALELAPQGIRVNAVCPGDVDTAMLHAQAAASPNAAAYLDDLRSGYPQGPKRTRFVRPDEVAELIWFLCQPHAQPITGANLSIDFGLSAGLFPPARPAASTDHHPGDTT